MDSIDLTAACDLVGALVRETRDADLEAPTPCPAYDVADLLDHLGGLALAFEHAARKAPLPDGGGDPSGDGSRLEPTWRDRIAADLQALAAAWRDPAAHEGETQAGPVVLPAPVAAMVALNEVVVHGWDLAVATGRDFAPDPVSVAVCTEFVAGFEPPAGGPADDGGLFGPPVAVADDAPPLDRLLGLAGRRPDWAGRSPH